MEKQNEEKKEQSFLETVMRDVMGVVKHSKQAEMAFESYYASPSLKNKIDILNSVSNTDFYRLGNKQQHYVSFVIGLICKTLLDNSVDSEYRKKFNAFPNISFIRSLAWKYSEPDKHGNRDENFRTRIVNVANCNSVDEIVSYIRTELAHYIDRSFNIYWLVCSLLKAEDNTDDVVSNWVIKNFLWKVSGKKSENSVEKEG